MKKIFDNNNKLVFKFGSKGFGSEQFQDPCYVAMDCSDQVYVTNCCSDGEIKF